MKPDPQKQDSKHDAQDIPMNRKTGARCGQTGCELLFISVPSAGRTESRFCHCVLGAFCVLDNAPQTGFGRCLPLYVVELNSDYDLPERHDFAQENVRPRWYFERI